MRTFKRKGQAALEFMMTYGWAILVVLAAIGALSYFGVLNPSKFTPDSCLGTSGVSCAGKPIINMTTIKFTMVNGLGYTLTPGAPTYSATLDEAGCINPPAYCPIGNITCGPSGDGPSLTSIPDGGSVTIVISGCNFSLLNVVKGEMKIPFVHPQSRLTENVIISVTGKIAED
jgi:hypothetical protein